MYRQEDKLYDPNLMGQYDQYYSTFPASPGDESLPVTSYPPCARMESQYKENAANGDPSSPYLLPKGLSYDPGNPNNPFLPYCRIPIPNQYGDYGYGMEPAFIRKRNERERERVRCVNDGYDRLRQHIPMTNKDKRVSKVETLRAAITYIQNLQDMLGKMEEQEKKCKVSKSHNKTDQKYNGDLQNEGNRSKALGERKRKRQNTSDDCDLVDKKRSKLGSLIDTECTS